MEDLERDLLSIAILYYFLLLIVISMGFVRTKRQFWSYITPLGLIIYIFTYVRDWYKELEDE
jgi:polyferredoxin